MVIVKCGNCSAEYELEDGDDPSLYICANCNGSLFFLDEPNSDEYPLYDEDPVVWSSSSYTEKIIYKYNFYVLVGAFLVLISFFAFYAGFFIFFISLIAGIVIIVYAFDKRQSWEKGVKGEKIVADRLKNLSRSFIFNDVNLPNGLGNIDHVVVGFNGVFAIETKNFSGNYVVRGNKWYFKRGRKLIKAKSNPGVQVLRNSILLRDFLKGNGIKNKNLWVYGIVSMVNGSVKIIKSPKNYFILKPSEINKHIRGTRKRLDEDSIYNICSLISEFSSEIVFKEYEWPQEWIRCSG